jgi:hypothetical protein
MSFHIDIREIDALSFRTSTTAAERDWIETSFSSSPRAVGELRLPRPDHERYAAKHPILRPDGTTAGFLIRGVRSLGRTFRCVYAAGCFWIVHERPGPAAAGGVRSGVSIVDRIGTFRFSRRGAKFGVVKSFEFGRGWPNTIRAFKLLDERARLLYLTNYGVCLFDTKRREAIARVEFNDCAYQWSGFALSPTVKLLALGCSVRREKDPISGRHRYENFVRMYNLESGEIAGEHSLAGDRQIEWAVHFSDDGRQMRLASPFSTRSFNLQAV